MQEAIARVSFGEDKVREFFTDEQREYIISLYPENLRQYVANVSNPLNIDEILISLTSKWNVRIVFVEIDDEYGDKNYIPWFNCNDIAKVLDYSTKSIHHWDKWIGKEDKVKYCDIHRMYENKQAADSAACKIYSLSGDIRVDSPFLSSSALRTILSKVNKPASAIYIDLLNGLATSVQKIMMHISKIANRIQEQKYKEEICVLKASLEQRKIENKQGMYKAMEASDIWRKHEPHKGYVYIAKFNDKAKALMRKVGIAKSIEERQQNYNTSDNVCIIYSVQCNDVRMFDKLIDALYPYLRVYANREFYWECNDERLISSVSRIVEFVNNEIENVNEIIDDMRREYMEGEYDRPIEEGLIKVEPSRRSRSRSPSKKSLIDAEVKELRSRGEYRRGDRKKLEDKMKGEKDSLV